MAQRVKNPTAGAGTAGLLQRREFHLWQWVKGSSAVAAAAGIQPLPGNCHMLQCSHKTNKQTHTQKKQKNKPKNHPHPP